MRKGRLKRSLNLKERNDLKELNKRKSLSSNVLRSPSNPQRLTLFSKIARKKRKIPSSIEWNKTKNFKKRIGESSLNAKVVNLKKNQILLN